MRDTAFRTSFLHRGSPRRPYIFLRWEKIADRAFRGRVNHKRVYRLYRE